MVVDSRAESSARATTFVYPDIGIDGTLCSITRHGGEGCAALESAPNPSCQCVRVR